MVGVTEISPDHDSGNDARGTGYDLPLWIEEAVFMHKFSPPIITIHFANASAREKISLALNSIEKLTLGLAKGN
mgnify:CR=1 FL=1